MTRAASQAIPPWSKINRNGWRNQVCFISPGVTNPTKELATKKKLETVKYVGQ